MNDLTAAHRSLPLGTRLMVTNLDTGQAVEVRVNDRGPLVEERILDLSYAAARVIGADRVGVIPVRLRILAPGSAVAVAGPPYRPAPGRPESSLFRWAPSPAERGPRACATPWPGMATFRGHGSRGRGGHLLPGASRPISRPPNGSGRRRAIGGTRSASGRRGALTSSSATQARTANSRIEPELPRAARRPRPRRRRHSSRSGCGAGCPRTSEAGWSGRC